ncbi:2-C-methyl-D-erythritol 2,4-cyclodiphosphate synthase [Reinekea thalattae]|uniref:2-C-methyl-D-erythritol 2,4-cyclodiphosphate synthase n=1 Tax=Reinekea thalattae TaxID=2593301 RepID=A0A5C8Z7Y5_9GAMM|nr:2-C-methyl-D-erythritol 2,4-cyclodiphosphate synthase [Reinekea thalattae]TXR54062.1 2-C-methyl-D-erythritol 2,4-cyclodiphosphate synthase [Reinekea thalattae]
MFRIGHGYDVHKFDQNSSQCTIKLGGIDVGSTHSLLAHSDGDVVLHALTDALLGAIAQGDIGEHFPDTDERWKGADSGLLLQEVYRLVNQQGYQLVNADISIAAQAPRLKHYKLPMARNIAQLLNTEPTNVNVKATTTEKLGFVGRKEGIAVDAVCLIERVKA